MPRELLLLRHAKSDWRSGLKTDLERPLSKRGIRAARTIGRMLSKLDLEPDLVLTSPATRATATVELASKAGEWECPIESHADFYERGPAEARAVLRRVPDRSERVLAVGHEPTWSELAGRLLGQAELRLPTAGLARLEFDIDTWRDLAWGSGVLIALLPVRTMQTLHD